MTDKRKKKFDCWSCKWRGECPGSAHICCKHPSLKEVNDDPVGQIMRLFASMGRVPLPPVGSKKLNIKGNPHGIRRGWFNFPFDFDPVWLENCDGYEEENDR